MDTSRLPEPLRSKLEARLALLPAAYRATIEAKLARLPPHEIEQALDRASPLIDRLLGASRQGQSEVDALRQRTIGRGGATISGVRKPEKADEAGSHYNRTVQRGDPPLPAMGAVLLALLGIAVITWRLGWWSF